MAYQSGDIILDDHYNTFVQGGASGVSHTTPNVNSVWGTGTSDKGYGQSGNLATVSAGTTITATQWANLLNRANAIANHQGTTLQSIANPATGDTIAAYTSLSANINSIYNNRYNAAGSGSDSTSTASNALNWYTSASTTRTITFGSHNAARYFFNAGGMIRLSYGLSSSPNNKSTEWADLLSQTGTIVLTAAGSNKTIAGTTYAGVTKIGGAGTANTIASLVGFHDLTTTSTLLFRQYADSDPYTSNYISIAATYNGSGQISITTTLTDAAADTTTHPDGSSSTLDRVGGTLTGTMVVRPPSTTYISNTWGTPTVNSTTWSGS